MNLYPKTETLNEILSAKRKYIIPAYQRPYEWGKDEINNMLNSISEHIESDSNESLLFGTLQFNSDKSISEKDFPNVNSSKIECEIIDGHQRITTFYLLKKFLYGDSDVKFPTIENRISGKLLEEHLESEKYTDNSEAIKEYFSKDNGEKLKEKFKEFINDKIIFVSIYVYVSGAGSIATTLKIFNSLNTAGLSLDVKDIFKINFCEYLCSDTNLDKTKVLQKINKAYESVTKFSGAYRIDENVLLDTFRFYIMSAGNGEKDSIFSQENLRASNNMFFLGNDGLFKGKIKTGLSKEEQLDSFCEIAECICKTQKYLQEKDKDIKDNTSIVNHFAKELLSRSGYGRLTNLYYLFVYEQYKSQKSEKEVTKDIITKAENAVTAIWKYCSIFAASYSRQVYRAYSNIAEVLNEKNIEVTEEKLKEKLKNEDKENFSGFNGILNDKAFDNRMIHFFVILSYIDDSVGKINVAAVKNDLFYRTGRSFDIEHIVSRKYSEDNQIEGVQNVNSLGNLMYLDRSLNRSLGEASSREKSAEKDLKNKIAKYKAWLKENQKNKLQCISAFLEFIEQYEEKHKKSPTPTEMIETRQSAKSEFLKNLYKNIYEDCFG